MMEAKEAARKITSLQVQKKNAGRVSVYVDGEFAFGLHQDLLLEYDLYQGRTLTEEEETAVVAADQRLRAREAALRFLGYRARTEREIRTKLRKLELSAEVIDDTVAYLKEHRYIDDDDFAERFAQQRIEGKGHGPARVRTDLYSLGIAGPIIDRVLEQWAGSQRVAERLHEVAQKRWHRLRHETDERKRRKKLIDFLMRRGFPFDDALQAAQDLASDQSD